MLVNPEQAGFCADKLKGLEEHLANRYVSPGKIPGCRYVVVRHGTTAASGTLGHSDLARGRVMTNDTLFRIYSMTKPITSVALMLLFEEGKFQLQDPVAKYIPSWSKQRVWVEGSGDAIVTRAADTPMTIQHLLTHTAGLTYGGLLPGMELPVDRAYRDAGITRHGTDGPAEILAKLANVPLLYPPGSRWSYSLATDVCGYLVEILSGKSLREFLRERLFQPLQMSDTDFCVPEEKLGRFAACYVRNSDKQLQLQDDPFASRYARMPSAPSGAGGLVSTLSDYCNFCTMLVNGGDFRGCQIIGRPTLALMTRNHLAGNSSLADMAVGGFSETSNAGVGFGLGFATTMDAVASGTVGEGDFYWGGYASTLFWVDPREEMFVVFMTQLIPSATFNFRGQIKNIVYGAIC